MSISADEVSRFLGEIRPAIEARSLRFMDFYSTRCQQIEGVLTEADIPVDIDGFYSEALSEIHLLESEPLFEVVDSTSDTITIRLPSLFEGHDNILSFKRESTELRIDFCDYPRVRQSRRFFLADGATPVVAPTVGDQPTPLQRAEAMLDSWGAGESAQYPWLSTRCRLIAQERFGDFWPAFSSPTSDEETTKEHAEEMISNGTIDGSLFERQDMALAWVLLKFELATAQAIEGTDEEVTIQFTVAGKEVEIITRWVDEFGNLYDDAYCDRGASE